MKLDLLTNATVVGDAMRFAHGSKDKLKLIRHKDSQEPKEPDYDEDQDQLEEEQEEQAGEITVNQVF